jgi:tetratricopeptide (TPR) repeat protein
VLHYSGRSEEALGCFDRALALDPFFPDMYLQFQAQAQYQLGRYPEAAALLKRRILRNPDTDTSCGGNLAEHPFRNRIMRPGRTPPETRFSNTTVSPASPRRRNRRATGRRRDVACQKHPCGLRSRRARRRTQARFQPSFNLELVLQGVDRAAARQSGLLARTSPAALK